MEPVARRSILQTAITLIAADPTAADVLIVDPARAQNIPGSITFGVKALLFDVFGTCVDWRTSVARETELILKPRGYNLDWLAFASAWRSGYDPAMEEVRSGRIPFVQLDLLHRTILDALLPKYGAKPLPEEVAQNLNHVWHRLDGWPDLTSGMGRLSDKLLVAPCSNGNVSLMMDIARRNKIRFDAILGAEIAQDYKPKPRVYLSAVEAFGLLPSECMMICAASHTGDIQAASKLGLKTGTLDRPNEHGPGNPGASFPKIPVDIVATDLNDLAEKLGV